MAAEESRRAAYPKNIIETVGYLEDRAALRHVVDQCANEYLRVLSNLGLPEQPPQHASGSCETVCQSQFSRPATSGSV